jgi:hypothetical protein
MSVSACGSPDGGEGGKGGQSFATPSAGSGGDSSSNGATGGAAGKASTSGGTTSGGGVGGGEGHVGGDGGKPAGGASQGGSGGTPIGSGPVDCRTSGDGKSTITLINQCQGALSFRGSDIQGGDLRPGEHACRDVGSDVESIPAIRFWGFIGEDPGGERYTLAELTLNTDFNDFDWYNISHVDAHNLPMQVSAVDMPKCRTLTCANSLLAGCPVEGQLKDAGGTTISCFSPNRDDENSVVAQYFEAGCADAYSWSGDDQDSVVACAGEDYDVVFCP